jgi:hypothetical protein
VVVVTILKALDTDTPSVTVRAANMVDILTKDSVDICGCLTSSSGSSTCPSAGSYSVDTFNIKIPGDSEDWYANLWYW